MYPQNPNNLARISGLLYLIIAICGGYAVGFAPTVLFAETETTSILQSLSANQAIYYTALLGHLGVVIAEVALCATLYNLLKPFGTALSLTSSAFRFIMAAAQLINILPLVGLNMMAGDPSANAQSATLLLHMHNQMVFLWQICFALHLLLLAFLILRADFLPRWLGYFFFVGALGYGSDSLIGLIPLLNDILFYPSAITLTIGVIGELILTFWLLIRGTKSIYVQ